MVVFVELTWLVGAAVGLRKKKVRCSSAQLVRFTHKPASNTLTSKATACLGACLPWRSSLEMAFVAGLVCLVPRCRVGSTDEYGQTTIIIIPENSVRF